MSVGFLGVRAASYHHHHEQTEGDGQLETIGCCRRASKQGTGTRVFSFCSLYFTELDVHLPRSSLLHSGIVTGLYALFTK